jgi:uncharacterized protein (TIGR00369 family)
MDAFHFIVMSTPADYLSDNCSDPATLPVSAVKHYGRYRVSDLDFWQKELTSLFPGLLGVELTEMAPERVRAHMRVRPDLATTGSILHGGAFMAFADTLGALATVANLAPGANTVTIESKTNFLRGAAVGVVVSGECTPLHRGKTTMVWQTRISSADGKLCAVVIQTQLVLPARA